MPKHKIEEGRLQLYRRDAAYNVNMSHSSRGVSVQAGDLLQLLAAVEPEIGKEASVRDIVDSILTVRSPDPIDIKFACDELGMQVDRLRADLEDLENGLGGSIDKLIEDVAALKAQAAPPAVAPEPPLVVSKWFQSPASAADEIGRNIADWLMAEPPAPGSEIVREHAPKTTRLGGIVQGGSYDQLILRIAEVLRPYQVFVERLKAADARLKPVPARVMDEAFRELNEALEVVERNRPPVLKYE